MKFKEHNLAHEFLDGLQGLEIGAASHNPFGLKTRNVAPFDDYGFYSGAQEKMGESPARVDIWSCAEAIPVPNDSEDFVISSHVLEHVPNLIATFWEWNRIVRAGGYIFMILPLRTAHPEDVGRELTLLQHFVDDFRQLVNLDTHTTEGVPGGRMGHYHVFEPATILAVVEWMKEQKLCAWQLVAREDVDSKVGNGFTLVFQVLAKAGLRSKETTAPLATACFSTPAEEIRRLLVSPRNASLIAEKSNIPTTTIGLFGTFEIDNYGDLLFPIILQRMLERDIPGLQLSLFSPSSGVYKFNGAEIRAVTELESVAHTLDGFVLGGGDIVRFDAPAYDPRETPFPPYGQLAILPALLAGTTGKPFVWNAPGIPHTLTPAQRMILHGIQSVSAYTAVRDDQSQGYLGVEDHQVNVVPDTGFLLADLFPKEQLAPVHEKLKERYSLADSYGVLHISPATSDPEKLESATGIHALAENMPLILLPLGPVHREIEVLTRLRDLFPDNCQLIANSLHPLEIAALIAHSRWFVGTSLHGSITAFAYGTPGLVVNTKGLAKLDHFGKLTGRRILKAWDELEPAFRELMRDGVASDEANRMEQIRAALLVHFRRMKEALGKTANGSAEGLLKLVRGLISAEREKKAATGENASLAALKKTLTEHNRFIAVQRQIIDEKNQLLDEKQAVIDDLNLIIQTERNSIGGQALDLARSVRHLLAPNSTWRHLGLRAFAKMARFAVSELGGRVQQEIAKWLRHRQDRTLEARRLAQMKEELNHLPYQPLISIVTPVYNVAELWLRKAIDSVRQQVYSHWELCLVNDASTSEWISPVLDEYAACDSRIRVKHLANNEGIAGASNQGLALAGGEFVGLLDHDDELTPDALFEMVKRLNQDKDLDLLYSDEDKIQAGEVQTDAFFKPGWNPDLLLSCNYITHFSLFRRSLLEKIGGFRPGFDGSQDYDLLLRFTEETNRIAHIAKILYHWRAIRGSAAASTSAKPLAYAAARRALTQAVSRRGDEAEVKSISPGIYRVHYVVRDNPRVSIIVQPQHEPTHLRQCLASLTQTTGYHNYEVIVLSKSEAGKPKSETWAHELGIPESQFSISVLSIAPELPTGEALNLGVRSAKGGYLVFLSPELQIIQADWLSALLEQAQRKEVGAVGIKLLGADGRILHCGMVLDHRVSHLGKDLSPGSIHRVIYMDLVRDCSAVSADCLMVAKHKFEAVNGFDSRFGRDYHDADLCLRLAQNGYRTLYTPHAAAQFMATKSHRRSLPLEDERLFRQIWGSTLHKGDPYFPKKLTKQFRLAG